VTPSASHPDPLSIRIVAFCETATVLLECAYVMFGTHDGIVIADLPDSVSAAAISIAVTSAGTFKHVETHELFTQQQLGQALEKAKNLTQAYQPPGQQT
jgi:uncharacterized protein with GYD domain